MRPWFAVEPACCAAAAVAAEIFASASAAGAAAVAAGAVAELAVAAAAVAHVLIPVAADTKLAVALVERCWFAEQPGRFDLPQAFSFAWTGCSRTAPAQEQT